MIDNEKPLVSVLVPAYNHKDYVIETILSIINQTYGYENIQLIVIDDFSTDKTAVILYELAAKYDFKLIVHKQNLGVCTTLNEMISLSKGEYITACASDDIMILDRIENQINILKNNPDIDILAGDDILIDQHGKTIYTYSKDPYSSLITYSFDDLFLMLKPGFAAGSVIFKSDLFQRIGSYDTNYKVEDYYFWLKAAYHKAKIVKCNLPFLYYRVHDKSFSSNNKLMDQEVSKILAIYNLNPKYSTALQNREFYNMSKWIFYSKITVVLHLIKNPKMFLNKKIIKILAMLILPTFMLKRKFPEIYSRHATI